MSTNVVEELGRIPMSPFLTATLTRAAEYAAAQTHREVLLEHLLLALAEDPEASIVLKTSNVDIARLTIEVSDFLGHTDDRVAPGSPATISADLKRILEAAAAAAQQGRRREINGAIVLAAIVGDGRSSAAHMLRTQGLTFEEAIRALRQATATPQPVPAAPAPQSTAANPSAAPSIQRQAPAAEPVGIPTLSPGEAAPLDLGSEKASEAAKPAPSPQRFDPVADQSAPAPAPPPIATPTIQRSDAPRAPHPAPRPAPSRPMPQPGPVVTQRQPSSGPAASPPQYPPPVQPAGPQPRLQPPGSPWPDPYAQRPPSDLPRTAAPGQPTMLPQGPPPSAPMNGSPIGQAHGQATAPVQMERRRPTGGPGPFVGNWPLIEAGQLVENIPRRMRIGLPMVVEARVARADVKAIAEGLQGGGAAYRHEVVVTKAMSVRLRAPEGGFWIEPRSPETQWIENVLGVAGDDFASWRWTVTAKERGRRQLQLIVSARTVGADGLTAETALPDQVVDVKVGINYAATARRFVGWTAAAIAGGILARFGDGAFDTARTIIAKLTTG